MQHNTLEKQGKAAYSKVSAEPIAFEEELFEDAYFDDESEIGSENPALQEQVARGRRVDVEGIIALTVRLAQVLAQEADLLAEMRITDVEKLQKEKIALLEALEAQKRFVDRHPELLNLMSDEECLELAQIIEIFQTVMRENYRRLLIAKEVNLKVVEAISSVVKDSTRNGFYDESGRPEAIDMTVSMTVDKRI